jgi:hypothetical protein
VNARHDVTVWASRTADGPRKLVATMRSLSAGGTDCIPVPDGVSPNEINTKVQVVVGPKWVASTDIPAVLRRVREVLGGRLVSVVQFTVCGS